MATVKKINFIKDMATFKSFYWDEHLIDSKNLPIYFRRVNILYGRNYSGKTTISRIIRSLETKAIPQNYLKPEFSIQIENDNKTDLTITDKNLDDCNFPVRVFNCDFIKEHLRFIIDEDESVSSFAILGDENNKIEKEIKEIEAQLNGTDAQNHGLLQTRERIEDEVKQLTNKIQSINNAIEDKLREKANNTKTGIKHNRIFGDANYNVTKIKNDIGLVSTKDYVHLTEQEIYEATTVLKEEVKVSIAPLNTMELINEILTTVHSLISRSITPNQPIQELLNDALLQEWVRKGKELHQNKLSICSFCGGHLNPELWAKLDNHFSVESEIFRHDLDEALSILESLIATTKDSSLPHISNLYSVFHKYYNELQLKFENLVSERIDVLNKMVELLNSRKSVIFSPICDEQINYDQTLLDNVIKDINLIINESNELTKNYALKQNNAKTALRLHEVSSFITDINYKDSVEELEFHRIQLDGKKNERDQISRKVNELHGQIQLLQESIVDESRGAERVNELLAHHFGHPAISLKAVKSKEDGENHWHFEIIRDSQKAYYLSEGERTLVAFCYFIAKLEDSKTVNAKPIIWIDDPISSLDSNHIFYIFSLIESELAHPTGSINDIYTYNHSQLFISTHNLDFLRYLKRLSGMAKLTSAHFIITNDNSNSLLQIMPPHLQEYATEFNFLFQQIFRCAALDPQNSDNYNYFFSFGNNSRKFLEALLYFKYPTVQHISIKMKQYFGNDIQAIALINRVINEFSHLKGRFDRAMQPFDCAEIQKCALFLLRTIKQNDQAQYLALLESIGCSLMDPA